MEKLSMCRICLKEDFRLHSIVETHLQEMYESLVLVPFETKDSRPILICYICCARLQNCYELRRSCLQSEDLFTQMLSCDELEPVKLQEIDNKKRLTMHHVVNLSIGHELQMSADNVGVEALTCDDVKVEQSDPEDVDEDALEEYSVYDNIQSADSDDDPLIIVKEEQSGDRISDPTLKNSHQAVPRNPQDITSNNLKEHELVQDMFKELNEVTAADNTAAESTNEVTFTLNDNNKERSTSVPHSERVQYTCDTCQRCYSSKCMLERHIRLCSDVWKKDLSRDYSTSSHTHTGQRPRQCHVCKKSLSCVGNLTRHMRTHTGEKPYQCEICKKHFSQKIHLSDHMRTHTGEKPYHCDICKKYCSTSSNLITHMRTHTGEKPFHCNICKKQFSRKVNLSSHMCTHTGEKPFHSDICKKQKENNKLTAADKTAAKSTNDMKFTLNDNNKERSKTVPHSKRVQYTCDTCQQCYSSKCKLERHIHLCSDVWKKDLSRENSTSSHTHTGQEPHQCHFCEKSFSFMSHLTRHIRLHTSEKQYQCHVCKKSFSCMSKLTRHICTHTGKKQYRCHVCKKYYSQNSTLISHMRTHTGEKPHQCHICKKSFSCMSKLTRHICTHTGEKQYQCHICKKYYSQNSTLFSHMRTHTGEKPYHCEICKKQFSIKGNLTDHMRTHTGEKPYHCEICKKQFSIKGNLTDHMRTHTGEKPYHCEICKKQFSIKGNLTDHMRTHTGVKPHQCDICKKCFSVRNSLMRHIRTHTCKKRSKQGKSRLALT